MSMNSISDQVAWRVLCVDDESDMGTDIKEYLESDDATTDGDRFEVVTAENFNDALNMIVSSRYDLVILDVRRGSYQSTPSEEAGEVLLAEMSKVRFIPVIFHTGLPRLVEHLKNSPFIQVVTKEGTLEELLQAVRNILESRLADVNRALTDYVDLVQRDYMWDFVSKNWDNITSESDESSLAYLLARRLAMSLSDTSAAELAANLGSQLTVNPNQVHPMQFYVIPPMENPSMMAGRHLQRRNPRNSGILGSGNANMRPCAK